MAIEKSSGVLPIKINSAYCDKDTFLEQLKGITDQNLFQFSNIDADHTTQQTLFLTSPNRSNQKLFLEGEVTVYTPKASSRVTISEYQTKTKKRIKNKILEQNGIIIYVFRKNEYDELLLNAREIASGSLFNNPKAYNVLLDKYGPIIADFIKYHNPHLLDGYDIYFIVSGNWNNVVKIEMLDTTGTDVKNNGSTLFSGNEKITLGLNFNGNLLPSGKIRIDIIQKGDTHTLPFRVEAELP